MSTSKASLRPSSQKTSSEISSTNCIPSHPGYEPEEKRDVLRNQKKIRNRYAVENPFPIGEVESTQGDSNAAVP